ncbi:MAG: hypothetical protein E7287_00680 [Lachnospiraceae bacterium]|nr:hypothetical protein [Lachnospiraceae bacterium]
MRYIKPQYYDTFKCTADKCPDTCCAGWQIMIDEDSLERYESVEGEFGKRIKCSIDWSEGSFLQKCGRCAMLNEKNLCDLVIACGEDSLCETCGRYPRHIEEFEGLREYSLSISCPVAAEIVLGCEEPLNLIEETDDEEDPLWEEFEDFDILLFTKLEDAREAIFKHICQDSKISLERRMHEILKLAEDMQVCVDEDRVFDMDAVIGAFSKCCYSAERDILSVGNEEKRFYRLKDSFSVFYSLERMRPEWTQILDETWETLYADGFEQYSKKRTRFLQEYGDGGRMQKEWNIFKRNLLLFFLYTYFCGAVYDDWIYSKVALSVFSVIFVQEFVMCRYILTDNNIDKYEWVKLAYRYAREVEHSDDNLNLLEEWLQNENG